MPNDIAQRSLEYLYKELRRKRISWAQAEIRNADSRELDNLRGQIEIIEWLAGLTLKEVGKDD